MYCTEQCLLVSGGTATAESITTIDDAMRLLNLPMVEWQGLVQSSEAWQDPAPGTDLDLLAQNLLAIAVQAVRLSRYIEARQQGSHEQAVKRQNTVARQVRRALGFSYPDQPVNF